jgi:hypothetical protein
MVERGALPLIIKAMKTHPSHALVQKNALGALYNISVHGACLFCFIGFFAFVRVHNHYNLHHRRFFFVFMYLRCDTYAVDLYRPVMAKLEGAKYVAHALRQHPKDDPVLVQNAVATLWNLTFDSNFNCP